MSNKTVKRNNKNRNKQAVSLPNRSFDKETPIWCFDNVDNSDIFRLSKETVNCNLMIDKLLLLSKMTWAKIKAATHDDGKSKNHELDYNGISIEGQNRIRAKNLSDEDIDTIFSIAFTNKIRLIGLKKDRVFHAMWYDENHEFYPVKR